MKERFDLVFKWALRLLALWVAFLIIYISSAEYGEWNERAFISVSYYLIPLAVGVLIRWITTGKHLN